MEMDKETRDGLVGEVTRNVQASITRLEDQIGELRKLFHDLRSSFDSGRHISEERETRLTNQLAGINEAFRRIQAEAAHAKRTAEEAVHNNTSVFESVKSHTKALEKDIHQMRDQLRQVSDENQVQTSTLAELASGAEARIAKHVETQGLVVNLSNKVDTMLASEKDRREKEIARDAVEKKEAERKETFWKRLPVYITLSIVGATIVIWLLNAMVATKTINVPVTVAPAPAPTVSVSASATTH